MTTVSAQDTRDIDQGDERTPTRQQEPSIRTQDKGGYPVGSFLAYPSFAVTERYSSNIFATQRNRVSDWTTILSPSLRLESDWKRHALNFWTGADVAFFAENPRENYQDFWVGSSGRFDIDRTANVFADLTFSREHEDRASPDDVFGRNPTIYYLTDGTAGILKRWGKWIVRIGSTVSRYDFQDSESLTRTINNDDRDRTMYTIGGRVGWDFTRGWQLFVQSSADVRSYDSARDDNGFDRDSTGFNAAAGLAFRLLPKTTGEIYVGYMRQHYEDSALPVVQGLDFGGEASYRASERLLYTVYASRSVEETTLFGASGYLSTVLGARVDYRATNDITLTGRAVFDRADYSGIARNEDTYGLYFRTRYQFTRQFYGWLQYGYRKRESNVVGQGFVEHSFMARLGVDLAAPERTQIGEIDRNSAAAAKSSSPEQIFAGFYVGVQGGFANDLSNAQGVRGPGSSWSPDFGDHGAQFGPFAGYGLVVNRVYLGGEIDGDWSRAGWDHARAPQGRFFSVNRRHSIGGSFRLGYIPRTNAAMLYARVGLVHTSVDTRYIHRGVLVDRSNPLTGLRIGVGIEVPVTGRTFVRMDYSHTEYPRYRVNYLGGSDTFENSANILLVGLGFRFNPEGSREHEPPKSDFSGPFVGLNLGHGTLESELSGARDAGSTLFADFAGTGFTGGGLAGYGFTFDRFYLGGEVSAEGSGARWSHRRGFVGRDFSVRKRFSLGAAARVGYIVRNAVLLYGKAGVAWTSFRTDYNDGANNVSQIDGQLGLRVGAGIEVPVAKKWFVRMDYSYTHYPSYTVNYGGGVDRFQNSENLFLVGVIRRFHVE